jgi:hypothetical protein
MKCDCNYKVISAYLFWFPIRLIKNFVVMKIWFIIRECKPNLHNFLYSKNKNVRKVARLSPEQQIQYMIKEKNKKGPKAQIDARFFAELKTLWGIMFPGLWSKESGLMVLIALSLISRSICDLWLIQHTTLVEG